MEEGKRIKIIKVAVSYYEHQALKEKAQGPLSPYLRNVGLGSSFEKITKLKKVYLPADPELLRQLGYIGNNINQIAKGINETRKSHQDVKALQVLFELNRIAQFLEELKEENWHVR